MIHGAEEELHPAEIELRHYVRGTLASGHAVAVLAHCILCTDCGDWKSVYARACRGRQQRIAKRPSSGRPAGWIDAERCRALAALRQGLIAQAASRPVSTHAAIL